MVPGGAVKLVFTSSTANLASGSARTLTAEIRDAAGNKVSSPNRSVTFAKSSGIGTVTNLPATVTSSAGVASRSVTAVKAGGITISASSSGLTSAATTFTIVPGAAVKLVFTSSTPPPPPRTARTPTPQVRDAPGN